jgi:hypothetical protein
MTNAANDKSIAPWRTGTNTTPPGVITSRRRGSRPEAGVVRLVAIALLGGVLVGCATVSDHARAREGGIDIQGHQRGVPGDICPDQHLYGPQELGFALYCWGSRT